jgi:hypothetical protein
MSQPEPDKPKQSPIVQGCAIAFLVVGIVGFQVVAPKLFPTPPGGGINFERTLWAGVVGAVAAVIGAGVGKLIEAVVKK